MASLQRTVESLQKTVEDLRADVAKRDTELAELRRALYGKRGEKMPPKERELSKADPDQAAKSARTKQRRAAAAQKKRELP